MNRESLFLGVHTLSRAKRARQFLATTWPRRVADSIVGGVVSRTLLISRGILSGGEPSLLAELEFEASDGE